MKTISPQFIHKKIIFNDYSLTDVFEAILRLWMGYILISNSGVGTITPLKELGLPEHIYKIIKGMWDTGFMMHLVKIVELVGGILLVLNLFTPLALLALIPVVVNIYGIHIFLFDSFMTNGLFMLVTCVFLVIRNRTAYLPLLKARRK